MSDGAYTLWPGTVEAHQAGCVCPFTPNAHGDLAAARERGGWFTRDDCPVHGFAGTHPAPIPRQETT